MIFPAQTKRRIRLTSLLLAAVLLLVMVIGLFSQRERTSAALSKMGSRGEQVRQIQQKLKNWGYYNGEVDGVFGTQTKNAVVYFQRKNGLTTDGVAGPATLRAMGIFEEGQQTGSNGAYSENDINMLANIISAEARGEPYEGQVAVGAVVLNRMEHPSFPDTLAGVVYQPGAFTAITDGQIHQPVSSSSRRAAHEALAGSDPTGGAIYYYNPDKTSNAWIRTRPVIRRIGAHLFCA